jgi:bifunctional UDP-N-acetylglucosamine pyrophosphorylase/glucosamine-1-phosphate N-acetyltransferase
MADQEPTPVDPRRVAVVLAAGRGKRMLSARPKVLHRAAGRPLLAWVLGAARAAGCGRVVVVTGHGADAVRAEPQIAELARAFGESGIVLSWATQAEQRGTGHALAQAAAAAAGAERVVVLSGDVPLVSATTLDRLLAAATAAGTWGAIAVADLEERGALGRVIAAPGDPRRLERIVEAVDATPSELTVNTINAGLYVLPAPDIFARLERLEPANMQGELYLTDAVNAAAADGQRVALVQLGDPREALGVNDRRELAMVHRILVDRHLDALMLSGVSVPEPARTTVEPAVRVGGDTVLHPGVSLLGRTSVGRDCVLHQGAWVRDSVLGDRVTVGPYSVLDGARLADGARLGPHACLAPAAGAEDPTAPLETARAATAAPTEGPAAPGDRKQAQGERPKAQVETPRTTAEGAAPALLPGGGEAGPAAASVPGTAGAPGAVREGT